MQQLVVVAFREGEPDRRCVLEKGTPCIIGRSPEAHLVLPDSTISRHHATLRIDGGDIRIEDNKSTNGVFINRRQVQQSTVEEGDFLTLGAYTLVLRSLGGPVDTAALRGQTHCIGVESARKLHEESLKAQVPRYFQVLYHTALLLGKRSGLEMLAPRVVAWVVQVLRARFGSIAIAPDEFQKPREFAKYSRDSNVYAPRLSENLSSFVMSNKTAILSNDPLNDPRFYSAQSLITQDIQSVMCTPLCGDERVVGILYIDNDKKDAPFATHDLEFLTAVGHLIGLAIENKMMEDRVVKHERLVSLGEAIAGISHDMSNVLTGILGGAEMLDLALQDNDLEEARRSSEFIRRTSSRVESYFAELVAFSKDSDFHLEETNIRRVIAESVEATDAMARAVGVTLSFDSEELPTEYVDPTKLYRVLANLIKNGVEACQSGGVVVVEAGRRQAELLIHVSDTGEGIAPEDISRLSEPFFSKKGSKGTGLGLAIAYRIVEQHGGSITVESQIGQGTCFTIALPAGDVGPAAARSDALCDPHEGGPVCTCTPCNQEWGGAAAFLADKTISVKGYKARVENADSGLYIFRHNCGTDLSLPAAVFANLYSQSLPQDEHSLDPTARTGTAQGITARTSSNHCARARAILQTLRNWPKIAD